MADRSAKAPGDPGESRSLVELDKDDRWQARLEEARARREVALREKAAKPQKKKLKPWETGPGDAEADEDFEIKPIIQDKPADEADLDFADRMEVMRETKEPEVVREAPVSKVEPAPERPRVEVQPEDPPEARVHDFSASIPVEDMPVAPPPKPKSRRRAPVVAPNAPDVIDLAHRYASTLKPPVNVTEAYVPPEPVYEPAPAPPVTEAPVVAAAAPAVSVERSFAARNRRPFGIGVAVLAFSLLPLAETAPPLEKGPPLPATPFFGLPPALGLTTSMVWRPEATSWSRWQPISRTAPLADFSAFQRSGSAGITIAADAGRSLPLPGAVPLETGVSWNAVQTPDPAALPNALGAIEIDALLPQPLPPMQSPRPVPKGETPAAVDAPQASDDAGVLPIEESLPARSGNDSSTVLPQPGLDDAPGSGTAPAAQPIERSETVVEAPGATGAPERPDFRTETPLKVTILLPNAADRGQAEEIAADATARGHELARIREVDVRINAPNVRYFHDEDRAEASRLARAYGAEVKDFTWFRPAPEKGTTEIWLSGRTSGAVARPGPDARPRPTVEEPQTFTVIRRQPSLFERLFLGRRDDIEIIIPNPGGLLDSAGSGGN